MTQDGTGVAWLDRQTQASFERLLPRLAGQFGAAAERDAWQTFVERLNSHFPRLFRFLYRLYGDQYDFFYYLENILLIAARGALARLPELCALDAGREADPNWFRSNTTNQSLNLAPYEFVWLSLA